MAVSHTVHDDLGVVVSTWEGSILDAEVLESYRKLYEDENWHPGFHEIVDLRRAQMGGVTVNTLRALVDMSGRVSGGTDFKSACVATDDLPFGMARLYQALSADSPKAVRVFREPGAALQWIGVGAKILD